MVFGLLSATPICSRLSRREIRERDAAESPKTGEKPPLFAFFRGSLRRYSLNRKPQELLRGFEQDIIQIFRAEADAG